MSTTTASISTPLAEVRVIREMVRSGLDYPVGTVLLVDQAEGHELIAQGWAEPTRKPARKATPLFDRRTR